LGIFKEDSRRKVDLVLLEYLGADIFMKSVITSFLQRTDA
jgi:hypothetical protein